MARDDTYLYLYRPINDKDSSRLFEPDLNRLYRGLETLRLLSGAATATILSLSFSYDPPPIELIRRGW